MALGKLLNYIIPHYKLHMSKSLSIFYNLESVALKSILNFQFTKNYSSGNNKDNSPGSTDEPDKMKKGHKAFRHGYPEELEAAVNHQILTELNASIMYLSMFSHYGRTDVALPGCQSFFLAMYNEEQKHALSFIDYQLMRGGEVLLFPMTAPEDPDWTDITVALGVALELEKRVKEKLEELVRLADCFKDPQLADFVTSKFLSEQNKSICEIGRLLTKSKRLVDTGGVGRHLFDKEVYIYMLDKNPEIKLPYKNI